VATRDEIKTFLTTDLITLLAATHPCNAEDIYFGKLTRTHRAANEIFLKWDREPPVYRDAGRVITSTVTIELYRSVMEPYEEPPFQDEMEAATTIILDTYDGDDAIDRFQPTITRDIDAVNCTEVTDIIQSEPGDMYQTIISKLFALEVITCES